MAPHASSHLQLCSTTGSQGGQQGSQGDPVSATLLPDDCDFLDEIPSCATVAHVSELNIPDHPID